MRNLTKSTAVPPLHAFLFGILDYRTGAVNEDALDEAADAVQAAMESRVTAAA